MNLPTKFHHHILFVDIETATQKPSFDELSDTMKEHWKRKMRHLVRAEEYPTFEEEFRALYHGRAAIYAEFARVICISIGYLKESPNDPEAADPDNQHSIEMKLRSVSGPDERQLLIEFSELLGSFWYDRHNQFLCGHNIREFDIPFLCRRMLVHGIRPPNLLNIAGQKPWQVHHILDTMEFWKFGDYKHFTSLDLLCSVLEIESPKGKMEGKDVSQAYWDGRIEEIIDYCQQDVIATARVYLKCIGREVFPDEVITLVD